VPDASLSAPSRRASRRTRRWVVPATLLALVLLLAGCSTPGAPNDFEDAREGFLEACVVANEGFSDEQAQTTCECWFDEVSDPDSGVNFEQFEREEDNIRAALDNDTFKSDTDFKRVAPGIHGVVTTSCVQTGPQAG
jgi:hypothetical protein